MPRAHRVLVQLHVCRGCTDAADPDAPIHWLRAELRRRGLLGRIGVSLSDCLGPCNRGPVWSIADGDGVVWLGGLAGRARCEALLEWATRCAEDGVVHPLPAEFRGHVFERFLPARPA